MDKEPVIRIEHLSKEYRLGVIGSGTLSQDLQSAWARLRGKEDPNSKVGDLGQFGKKFWALKDINLTINKGEAVGIIGANGAGKSTLLKILSRVTIPTEGDAYLNGRVASMLEVGTGFHGELTGRENIYMNGAILGMSRKEVDSKIEEIIDFSECRQFIDTPVKRYSSGMYVKLAFAVAAHLDAEILIMDEVLAVGDVKFQKKCLGKMGDVANTDGKTVLYVSHNMATIRQLCTRCIVLSHGQVVFDGDVVDAIGVYLENEKSDLETYYDLDNAKRPFMDHGTICRLTALEFIDRESMTVNSGEKIRFKMSYKSSIHIEDLRASFHFYSADSTPVGTMLTGIFGSINAGEEKTTTFEIDTTGFVAGKYYFIIDLFTSGGNCAHTSYDHPLERMFFDIDDTMVDRYVTWHTPSFGSLQLHDAMVVD